MLKYTKLEGCDCGCIKWVFLYRERGVNDENEPTDYIFLECNNCGTTIKYNLMNGEGGES